MKRWGWFIAALFVLELIVGVAWVFAASETYEFEQIPVSSTTVKAFTVSKTTGTDFGSPACGALVTNSGGNIRFRVDGTSPTAHVGHLLASGQDVVIDSNRDVRAFKFIAADGVSASTVTVSYFKGCK